MPLTLCRISQNEKKRPQVEKYTTCGLFCVYGANTALYRFICVINAVFNSFDTVYLVFIAATGSNHTGFADSCIFTSCINIQPINAHTVIVHNGDLKRLVRKQ